jgi:hypothetical protein
MRLGRMSDNSAAIGERQFGLAPAKQFGFAFRNERPSDGLDHSSRCQRTFGFKGSFLDRGQHGFARVLAREWRRWHTIDADDANDLLNDIGASVNIRAPRRHGDFHALALACGKKSQFLQHTAHVSQRQFQARKTQEVA